LNPCQRCLVRFGRGGEIEAESFFDALRIIALALDAELDGLDAVIFQKEWMVWENSTWRALGGDPAAEIAARPGSLAR
jgi:hypothetical protein